MNRFITFQVGRDAYTGKFIPVAEAKRRKRTSIVQTIRRRKSSK